MSTKTMTKTKSNNTMMIVVGVLLMMAFLYYMRPAPMNSGAVSGNSAGMGTTMPASTSGTMAPGTMAPVDSTVSPM